jgi:hypothetical protein
MFFRTAPFIALSVVILSLGTCPKAPAAELREEVLETLRSTELPTADTAGLTDRQLSEVALLAKTVEAKRDNYARALELFLERIGAGKDVDQALIEYERAEISLAAEMKATRKVLEIIKKQDHLAHEWKKHRTLHPEHIHTVERHGTGTEHVLEHHGSEHAAEHQGSEHATEHQGSEQAAEHPPS